MKNLSTAPSSKTSKKAGSKSARSTAAKKAADTRRERAAARDYSRQLWALILFGIALILGVLTFLEGERLWSILHHGFFGLFGAAAYLVAPLTLLISVLLAFEKKAGSVRSKIFQSVVLLFLVCGAFHIFFGILPEGENFFQKFLNLYTLGTQLRGGGLAAALFGWSLFSLFGKTAAAVVICIVIVIFLFIIFGVTIGDIISFFKSSVTRPARQLEKVYQQQLSQRENTEYTQEEDYRPIDIPLGPDASQEGDSMRTLLEETQTPQRRSSRVREAKDRLLNQQDAPPVADSPKTDAVNEAWTSAEPAKPALEAPNQEIASEETDGQTSLYSDGGENRVYTFPPITLLKAPRIQRQSDHEAEMQQNAERLIDTLASFGVKTRLLGATRGPAVTRYELQPSAGVRISKITQLSADIALNLAATNVRIEAPIPNKAAVGIEVPNSIVSPVTLREVLASPVFKGAKSSLEVALGKDIAGNIITTDLAKMPHLLIAGTTGSGKSVCTNSMIISLLYRSSPADVRLLLVDPKMVEFSVYNGIPHLLVPVVTDPKKAAGALGWAVNEMENRYKLFAECNVKDLSSYNDLAERSDDLHRLPKIVVIIDEFADLMMTAPGDVESAVCRLAQKARAAGMHLVIATQRPSVDVITGLIKANITSRIALTVSSQIDSRTIIDTGGAEALLGRGDMLFKPYGSDRMQRIQGCFVSEKEIQDVVAYIKNNESAEYDQKVIDEIDRQAARDKGAASAGENGDEETDPLLKDAVECVLEAGQASTSLLQRKLKVGYARAARLVDQMEERGIVSGYEGSKPRKVLITHDQWNEKKMKESE